MYAIEQAVLQFIASTYELMQWPGVIVLMAIESACIPVPSELIMPFAGWMLIKNQSLPLAYILLAGVYGALGNTIGSIVAYEVGMWGGRPLLYKYGKYILVHHSDLERADRWFAKSGGWSVFASRLLPVVRTFISLPAGIARMDFIKFCVYTFAGSFIWSAALTYGGYQLGEHWEAIREVMRPFDPALIVIGLMLVGIYIYLHIKRGQNQEID
ncbi:MAG: DedA family protein [Dehalococcoidales bacterium]|nr:DedA family protein [Dehalococcoidales bacterium]